jgi:hypothetical protein
MKPTKVSAAAAVKVVDVIAKELVDIRGGNPVSCSP